MIVEVLKALSDSNRLRIVNALGQADELCACQIIELLGVTGATVSNHIKILVTAGLVSSRKDGKWVHYKLTGIHGDSGTILKVVLDKLSREEFIIEDNKRIPEIMACDKEELCCRHR